MNSKYLESLEELDHLFSAYLHKIKFRIFQNISEISIHSLRPFKYKNTCELCDNMLDKDKKGRLMVKNFFEEVIDVFHEKYNIAGIEQL